LAILIFCAQYTKVIKHGFDTGTPDWQYLYFAHNILKS
jgi:hypothetical protein